MPLAPADRTRLAHVLGLLGSPHAGERDAAALAADRLVRGKGLSWADVLERPATPSSASPAWPPQYQSSATVDLRTCKERLDLLTAWERQFVASLAQRRKISVKQHSILADIVCKVRASGPRAG